MRLEGQIARMGRGEMPAGYSWGDRRKRDHFEDLGLDGMIILKCIFKK